MSLRRKKSCKSKQSSASDVQTTDSSDQTTDSSESYTKLEEKNESSFTESVSPETNLKKKEQWSIYQTWASQNDGPEFEFKKRSLIKTDNGRHGSSPNKVKMSRGIKNFSVNKNVKRDSIESQKSTDSGAQTSSSEPTSENSVDLNAMFESSLYVSEKPDSNTKSESNENSNDPEATSFKEEKSNLQSRQTSIIKSVHLTFDSRRNKFPPKTVRFVTTHFNKKNFHPKQDVRLQEPFFESRERPSYHQNKQNFPSEFPNLHARRYRPNTSQVLSQPSSKPKQSPTYAYTKQYRAKNIMVPSSASIRINDGIVHQPQTELPVVKQNNTVQSQSSFAACPVMPFQRYIPPPIANTTARPVHMLSCNTKNSHYPNLMPSMNTNARALRHVHPPLNLQNLMPPCRKNVVILPYYLNSSHYRSKESPIEKFTTPLQYMKEPKTSTTQNVCKEIDSPSEASKKELNLTSKEPNQVAESPPKQPQSSELKEKDTSNTIALNLEQTEECQKTTYSDKISLKGDGPKKQISTTYFPLCSTAQGIMPLKALQQTSNQFSTSSKNDFMNASVVEPGNFSHQTYFGRAAQTILSDYSYTTTQSNVHNLTQSAIPEKSYRIQYQSTQQDLSTVSKYHDLNQYMHQQQNTTKSSFASQYYKDSNQSIHQHETECQPNMQNLFVASHYQDQNLPTYQYAMQYQSTTQGVYMEPQYQNPYASMNQYQPTPQNTAAVLQYQNTNLPFNQNTNLPFNQNINPPFNQNINPPFNQYTNLPFNQYTNLPFNQYTNLPFNQYTNLPFNQNPNLPFNQYTNFPFNQNTNLPFDQNPNPLINQYQSTLQSLVAMQQYQNPNQPISQHGTQTSAESAWPIYDTSILTQQNTNMLPMQTHVTNPTSTNTIQSQIWPYESGNPSYHFTGDSNLQSNISDMRTEENLSFSSVNPYSPMSYVTNKTSQICSFDSYPNTRNTQENMPLYDPEIFETKLYPAWSVSDDFQNEFSSN